MADGILKTDIHATIIFLFTKLLAYMSYFIWLIAYTPTNILSSLHNTSSSQGVGCEDNHHVFIGILWMVCSSFCIASMPYALSASNVPYRKVTCYIVYGIFATATYIFLNLSMRAYHGYDYSLKCNNVDTTGLFVCSFLSTVTFFLIELMIFSLLLSNITTRSTIPNSNEKIELKDEVYNV